MSSRSQRLRPLQGFLIRLVGDMPLDVEEEEIGRVAVFVHRRAGPEIGNDSIQVMFTPNFSNGEIVRASDPAWLDRRIMSVVLSRPVRSSARSAMTANRVTLWG